MQRLCFLAVQPYFLTVGKPGGFANEADFYRFAAEECGFEGVTLPAGPPFIDIGKAITSGSYRDDLQARMQKYGLKHGVVRLEMHVVGQNVCLHSSRILRMGPFLNPHGFRGETSRSLEGMAEEEMRRIIDASAGFGFRHLVGFPGGRGYAAAQAKWSAWPKHFPEWVLALLAHKWNPILEYAAQRGVVITFEIGHPENDLLTGENFATFYAMLSPTAQTAVGVNADGSHFVNVGTNPLPHFRAAAKTGCEFTSHYKWGAVRDQFDGSASPYGRWRPWSTASTSFYTIGTVGPVSLVRDYQAFMFEQHCAMNSRRVGGVDIVYEGECVGIPNPKQAMRIGAENCRALRDGKGLIRLRNIMEAQAIQLTPFVPNGTPSLEQPDGTETAIDPWEGGPFDAFADCPAKPWELLEMTADETSAARIILASAGFNEACRTGAI